MNGTATAIPTTSMGLRVRHNTRSRWGGRHPAAIPLAREGSRHGGQPDGDRGGAYPEVPHDPGRVPRHVRQCGFRGEEAVHAE